MSICRTFITDRWTLGCVPVHLKYDRPRPIAYVYCKECDLPIRATMCAQLLRIVADAEEDCGRLRGQHAYRDDISRPVARRLGASLAPNGVYIGRTVRSDLSSISKRKKKGKKKGNSWATVGETSIGVAGKHLTSVRTTPSGCRPIPGNGAILFWLQISHAFLCLVSLDQMGKDCSKC